MNRKNFLRGIAGLIGAATLPKVAKAETIDAVEESLYTPYPGICEDPFLPQEDDNYWWVEECNTGTLWVTMLIYGKQQIKLGDKLQLDKGCGVVVDFYLSGYCRYAITVKSIDGRSIKAKKWSAVTLLGNDFKESTKPNHPSSP